MTKELNELHKLEVNAQTLQGQILKILSAKRKTTLFVTF